MKNRLEIFRIVLSSIFLTLAIVLPFITVNNPSLGNMFCLMHFPILLCGFFCGWKYGLLIGVVAPLLRSFIVGMPPMFPTAICMSAELGVYGLLTGILYLVFPKKKRYLYLNLLISIISGKLIWGIMMFSLLSFDISKFGVTAFFMQGIVNAIPGLILQFALIPVLVMLYEKIGLTKHNTNI